MSETCIERVVANVNLIFAFLIPNANYIIGDDDDDDDNDNDKGEWSWCGFWSIYMHTQGNFISLVVWIDHIQLLFWNQNVMNGEKNLRKGP